MVALNFVLELANDVEAGLKLTTIRGKARCKPGDRLQLYTGQRTKACRKLGDAICESVTPIELHRTRLTLDGELLGFGRSYEIAVADGFDSYEAMRQWFDRRYGKATFKGFVIRWRLVTP